MAAAAPRPRPAGASLAAELALVLMDRPWMFPSERSPGRADDGRATLLVIDDDDAIRRVVRRTLESPQCRVLEAANGLQGLQAIDRADPPVDAVLTDLKMPVLDGMAVLRVLTMHRPLLPVLAMSADAGALSGTSVDILLKPFSTEVLSQRIGGVLARCVQMKDLARRQRADAHESSSLARLQRVRNDQRRHRTVSLVAAALGQ